MNWVILQFHSLAVTLIRPLRRKLRMRWFFDISKLKESSFFKSDLTDPPTKNFNAHLSENTNLRPSGFHFTVGVISRSCFESDGFIERMRLKRKKNDGNWWDENKVRRSIFWLVSADPQFSAQRVSVGVNRSDVWELRKSFISLEFCFRLRSMHIFVWS